MDRTQTESGHRMTTPLTAEEVQAIEDRAKVATPSRMFNLCDRDVPRLCDTIRLLRGALEAQTSREREAGVSCQVPYEQHGCDWPDGVAEVVIGLRARIAELESENAKLVQVLRVRESCDHD
jgi:hypothetical protein